MRKRINIKNEIEENLISQLIQLIIFPDKMEANQNRVLATIPAFEFELDDPDNSNKWKSWLRGFEIFTKANKITSDDEKFNWLLHCAGQKVQDIYHTLPEEPKEVQRGPLLSGYNPFETNEYSEAVLKLRHFFEPKQNTSFERHVFRQMQQNKTEGIDSFVIRLREQADRCGFDNQLEENIKDQITTGCKSNLLRRKILEKADCKLDEVLSRARILESVEKQQKLFELKATAPEGKTSNETANDEKVNDIEKTSAVCKIETSNRLNRFSRSSGPCGRCGYKGHKANDEKCPARGKECAKCGSKDHFARRCFSRFTKSEGQFKRKIESQIEGEKPAKFVKTETVPINMIEKVVSQSQAIDEFADVFALDTQSADNKVWCKVGNVEAQVVVDSGSRYNVIDRQTWAELKSKNIETLHRQKEVDIGFNAYGGTKLKFLGMFKARIEAGNEETIAKFYVADEMGKFLLGYETAFALKVLKIGQVNTINSALSPEFGKIKDVVIEIPLKPDVKGVVQPYRRTPVPLEQMVASKIDQMLNDGIIEKVNGVSKWVSPMVVTPKGNDIRICIDMRRANEAVERENYPMPTLDDFLPHLEGATTFSKLDVAQAFHQVDDDDDF